MSGRAAPILAPLDVTKAAKQKLPAGVLLQVGLVNSRERLRERHSTSRELPADPFLSRGP